MTRTMKAALLIGPGEFQVRNVPVPEPGADEVLVRVKAVGVCGSDVHFFNGAIQEETSYPLLIGHEFAGTVAALGAEVTGVAVGDRVACAPDRPCMHCEWCRRGETNVCPNVRFAACHGEAGCLAEYFVAHHSQLHAVPPAVTFEQAALFEPVATALHIVENLARPTGGETYAIVGAGTDGLATIAVARRNGASGVFVSDVVPERLAAAQRIGATATCDAAREDFARFVHAHTGDRGADVVVEASGAPGTVSQACRAAAIHGKLIILGIPPGDEVPFDLTAARRRELTAVAVRRSVGKYARALELIGQGVIDPEVFITHRFRLEETQQAFECARDRVGGVIKPMILL